MERGTGGRAGAQYHTRGAFQRRVGPLEGQMLHRECANHTHWEAELKDDGGQRERPEDPL